MYRVIIRNWIRRIAMHMHCERCSLDLCLVLLCLRLSAIHLSTVTRMICVMEVYGIVRILLPFIMKLKKLWCHFSPNHPGIDSSLFSYSDVRYKSEQLKVRKTFLPAVESLQNAE